MNLSKFALGSMFALSLTVSAITGCAGDRPMRNGVPNENLFLKKAFIIRPGVAGTPDKPAEDDGWLLKATVMETSTPNPLAESVLFTGAENGGMLVRFVATQDHLQLVNLREISNEKVIKDQQTRTPEVVNAWPAEHGDLKLAVNGDGEKTNRLEWNQELDWRTRAWVKVNLARGDLGDFALFGSQMSYRLGKCAGGGSVSVEPGSILVDEDNDYMEWKTNVTMPVNVADEKCMESFGESGSNFIRLGRQNVTAVVKYSMVRARPTSKITYHPLEIEEKDPIRRKYGPILETSYARDPESGKLAARELAIRFDPKKEVVFYFAKGYPEEKKGLFTAPGAIVDQTNALFEKAGAQIRLVVKNFDQDMPAKPDGLMKERGGREHGDVRFNFIRWMSDIDSGAPFIGVTQFVPDPRTGEALSASITIADFPLKEFVAQRVDAFLHTIMCRAAEDGEIDGVAQTVCADINSAKPWGPPAREVTGADGKVSLEPLPASCATGEVARLLPQRLNATYGQSSLFSKMQEYLGERREKFGPLGPRDFVPAQDADFHAAYAKLVPYYVFADPATNPFVTPIGDGGEFGPSAQFEALGREVEFHRLAGKVDRGESPFPSNAEPGFVNAAEAFLDQMQSLQLSHRDHMYGKQFLQHASAKMDEAGDLVAFTSVMEKAGRRCVDGHWETKEEWLDKLIQTYQALTVWHEFGHALGLDHNFMGSVDKANYPHYKAEGCDPGSDPQKCDRVGMYSSSVMEYASTPDRIFWANESGGPGWAPYDRGAIAWLYANDTVTAEVRQQAKDEAAKRQPEGHSGQLSATLPWKDPAGFRDDGKEISFLYCNASHTRYTPFCRQNDFGSTPSEIIANEIEAYEWQYAWRNFRRDRKIWDIHNYADIPAKEMLELRRFLPVWRQDWQSKSLRDDFGRFNIALPQGANSKEAYYAQLATKFDDEMSQTNQMVAAFHLAVIQQSSGERPYKTIIDKVKGDVTQQGISLDKQYAMQGWVGLWPQDNYDPNQRGVFISSYGTEFDPEFGSVAEKAVAAMIGEERFDAYPFLAISAVVLYARDTHNPAFDGKNMLKDWIGGLVFNRRDQLFDYFRNLALMNDKYPELGCAVGDKLMPDGTMKRIDVPSLATCEYNPMLPRGGTSKEHLSDEWNEFLGPDDHQYAWIYVRDRNQWAFVDKSRNTASYKVFRDYNEQITKQHIEDDSVFTWLLPVKVTMDAYLKYNNGPATGQ